LIRQFAMNNYNYKGVLKYTLLGVLLGIAVVVNAWLLNVKHGFTGRWIHIFDYSPDFIVISLAPLILGLIFCYIGIRWYQLKAFNLHIQKYLTEEQINSSRADQQTKLLARIVSQIDEAVVIGNKDARIDWVNDGFTNITGYILDEVKGKTTELFFGPLTDRRLIKKIEENLFKGESVVEELVCYRKDGSAYWAMISVKPIHDETGDITSYIAIQSDVTGRKEKEIAIESLYKEVADYKFALDQSAIVMIFDAEGKVNHVNKKFCDINGLNRKEEAENNFRNISLEIWDPVVREDIWRSLNEGKIWKGELINYCNNGTQYWAEATIVPLLTNKQGQKQFLAIQNEITERKELERKLLESKYKLEQAMQIAAFGVWEMNTVTGEIFLTKELREIYNLSIDESITLDHFYSLVHPDDLDDVKRVISKATQGEKSELEYRLVIKGEERHMVSNMAPSFDKEGELITLFGTVKDITERKVTELALKKSEEEKAAVLNNAQAVICLHDLDGIIIDVNPVVTKLTGFVKEELVGESIEKIIVPEFRDQFKYYLKEIAEKQTASGSMQILTKAGKRQAWLYQNALHSINDKPYVIASATDITETVKTTNELEKQKNFIRQIIDNSPNVIFVMDEQKRIVLANHTFREYYDYGQLEWPLADQLSKGATDIFLADAESLLDLEEGEIIRLEGCMESNSNKEINWFNVIKKCFREKSGKKYVLGFGMNITGRYQVETDLIAANEMVERSLKVKDQFIANMSHEIRTPLNAVIGFSDLLSNTKLNDEQEGYLKLVKAASKNLLALINNILDMTKIEAGEVELANEPLDIKQVVIDTVKLLEPKAKEKGISLRRNVAINIPEKVLGDQLRLSQIFYNLIGNAIKFTDKGYVQINCKMVNGPDEKKHYISFTVKDTGIGVAPEKQAVIFERFTQATSETEKLYGGTGLGLNIAKSIVDIYGGTLTMESALTKGSVFHFILPFNKYIETKRVIESEETVNKIKTGKPLNILLTEDNLINAMLAKLVLEREGHKVTHVVNGALAVDEVKENLYDIVLMDIQMPVMNGIEATKAIRQLEPGLAGIPIVAMTAHSLYGEMQSCFNAGMNGYVSKPFQPHDLFTAIAEATNPQKENKEAAMVD